MTPPTPLQICSLDRAASSEPYNRNGVGYGLQSRIGERVLSGREGEEISRRKTLPC